MITKKDFSGGLNGIPQFEDRKKMWSSLKLEEITHNFSKTRHYIKALQQVYTNGNVTFLAYQVQENEIFNWYASRNSFHEMGLFENFWKLSQNQKHIAVELGDFNFYSQDVFSYSSPFTLGGELASTLYHGGAYEKHHKGAVDAKDLADQAALEIHNNEYENTLVFTTHLPWSNYFFDIAWDSTWVIINKKMRRIFCILATDTD